MRSGGNIRRSLRRRNGLAEFRGGAVRRRERRRERGRQRRELGGVDRERKSAPPLGVGRGRDVAEKHFAFAAACRPIAEYFHGKARARLAAQLALHDEFARVLAYALERGGGETAVRRRLAVGRAIRADLGETSRRRSDADAALADVAFVLGRTRCRPCGGWGRNCRRRSSARSFGYCRRWRCGRSTPSSCRLPAAPRCPRRCRR